MPSVSPDGRVIVSGRDRTWVFDVATGRKTRVRSHGQTEGCAFSPDGARFLVGGEDGAIECWQFKPLRLLYRTARHRARARTLAYDPEGRFFACGFETDVKTNVPDSENTVRVYNVATGAVLAKLKVPTYGITSVAISPSGRFLACADKDGFLRIWRVFVHTPRRPAGGPAGVVDSGESLNRVVLDGDDRLQERT